LLLRRLWSHDRHARLLLLLRLLLWHHARRLLLLLLGCHLLALLHHLRPNLSFPFFVQFLYKERALRGVHALKHLALLLCELDGVAL
jgi:hypothetical protein